MHPFLFFYFFVQTPEEGSGDRCTVWREKTPVLSRNLLRNHRTSRAKSRGVSLRHPEKHGGSESKKAPGFGMLNGIQEEIQRDPKSRMDFTDSPKTFLGYDLLRSFRIANLHRNWNFTVIQLGHFDLAQTDMLFLCFCGDFQQKVTWTCRSLRGLAGKSMIINGVCNREFNGPHI